MAYGNLRRGGIAHLIFGVLSLAVGIALIVLYAVTLQGSSVYGTIVYVVTFASPAFCGIWAIIAGSIGTCANESRSNSIGCIRACVIVFSILSVLASIVQTALCAFTGWAYISLFTQANASQYGLAVAGLTWAGCGLGVLTFFTAIVHSGIGCCCPGNAERHEAYQMK